jgi:hypothetical protein
MPTEKTTVDRGRMGREFLLFPAAGPWIPWVLCMYYWPTRTSSRIPTATRGMNQRSLSLPFSAMINAAGNGLREELAFPPTWKKDCANSRRSPAAV